MRAPITAVEWRAIQALGYVSQPKVKHATGVQQQVLDRLIAKGIVMRDQATHLSHKPYRYWLSKKGINVRLLLKGLV